MVSAWDIYAKELFPLGYGHPLWGPEPSLETGEVRLGDIGYLRDGHFCFLFNTLEPADAPTNAALGVPDGFRQFDPPNLMRKRRMNEITQRQLHSKNVQSAAISAVASSGGGAMSLAAGLRYRCTEESGALLMLKHAAHKTYLDCPMHIKKYMKQHLCNWHQFANGHLGVGIEEKDIIFVSGFIKTTVWAEAAFSHRSSDGELFVSGGSFLPSMSGDFEVSLTRCVEPSVFCRSGPLDRLASTSENTETPTRHDQCIFLNYYKMKSRKPWGVEMRAAAGPHSLPPGSPDSDCSNPLGLARIPSNAVSDGSHTVSIGGPSMCGFDTKFDPVNDVLDYILNNSEALFAFSSEMDVLSLFSSQRQFPEDIASALGEMDLTITVDDAGVGTIDMLKEGVLWDLKPQYVSSPAPPLLGSRRGVTRSVMHRLGQGIRAIQHKLTVLRLGHEQKPQDEDDRQTEPRLSHHRVAPGTWGTEAGVCLTKKTWQADSAQEPSRSTIVRADDGRPAAVVRRLSFIRPLRSTTESVESGDTLVDFSEYRP